MAGIGCLYAETVSSDGSYGMLGVLSCCEILLLMNVADVDCLLCGRLWSEQC